MLKLYGRIVYWGAVHAESQPVSGLLECVAENKRPHSVVVN